MDKASDFGSEDCRFESCYDHRIQVHDKSDKWIIVDIDVSVDSDVWCKCCTIQN